MFIFGCTYTTNEDNKYYFTFMYLLLHIHTIIYYFYENSGLIQGVRQQQTLEQKR